MEGENLVPCAHTQITMFLYMSCALRINSNVRKYICWSNSYEENDLMMLIQWQWTRRKLATRVAPEYGLTCHLVGYRINSNLRKYLDL